MSKRTHAPKTQTQVQPAASTASPKKKGAKWLKVAGAALLLLAFGLQMRQNQVSGLALERTQAADLSSRSVMRAIGYENLY